MTRIVVVGGGISGLALAHRLEQRLPSAEVTVLEQQTRVGGTIGTVAREGFRVETGPNGFLDSKPTTADLCREVGLGEAMLPASQAAARNRFLLLKGKLHRLPTGFLSFLASGVLSARGKWRLLRERFNTTPPPEGDESIDAFARRRVGPEIAETLADAFVTGIYAGDPQLLSVRACFPRVADLERKHGSVVRGMAVARKERQAAAGGKPPQRTGTMWSFRDGLSLLTETLRLRLRTPPVVGVNVKSVRRRPDGRWQVVADGNDAWDADAVALTCPAHQQAALIADLDPGVAEQIRAIPYNRVAVVAVGYREADVPMKPDGFGYLTPQRERRDVLGVQWCSSIYPDRAPAGHVLMRAMCGGWHRAEMVDWDDARLVAAVRADLSASMGVRGDPVFHHVVRWDRAIPQYHVGHLARAASIESAAARHPGLHLGGNAYHGVALNDCVEQASVLADRIASATR